MPRYLAVYTMKAEDFALFRSMPKGEQDATDSAGIEQWLAWEKEHDASFTDYGAMVGKAVRVSRDGIAGASNNICGYIIVEADSIDAAARLFENHPHFSVFPGDGIEIMPFKTEPRPPRL